MHCWFTRRRCRLVQIISRRNYVKHIFYTTSTYQSTLIRGRFVKSVNIAFTQNKPNNHSMEKLHHVHDRDHTILHIERDNELEEEKSEFKTGFHPVPPTQFIFSSVDGGPVSSAPVAYSTIHEQQCVWFCFCGSPNMPNMINNM